MDTELTRLTIHETKAAIEKGETTYGEVTRAYAKRIEAFDEGCGAYLQTDLEKAIDQAKTFDDQTRSSLNVLSGIPYALKDNMCTKGIRTTCASKILDNFAPPYDATVCEKLNTLGGILLGKTNMDEFAMGSSTENSAYQLTRNPWNLTKVPGGSSGGSAVAVAADMAAYSLGSDTGGSIRQPAALCGVVGMKPTYGLISRYGLIAFASSLDQIGPITKDVEDCALVMNAICGYDPMDSTSLNMKLPDHTVGLKDGVKRLRIGIADCFSGDHVQPEVQSAMDDAVRILRSAGAEVVKVDFELLDYALPVYYIISCAEASANLARYDGIRYGVRAEDHTDLKDLYRMTRSQGFGDEVKRRIMLGTYVLSAGYYDAYYKKAMQVRTMIMAEYQKIFSECDLLLSPTTTTTAFSLGEKTADPLSMYMNDCFTVSANIAGLPGISLPVGVDDQGLPIGAQLVGPALSEPMLLKAAYALENAMGFRSKYAPAFRQNRG